MDMLAATRHRKEERIRNVDLTCRCYEYEDLAPTVGAAAAVTTAAVAAAAAARSYDFFCRCLETEAAAVAIERWIGQKVDRRHQSDGVR